MSEDLTTNRLYIYQLPPHVLITARQPSQQPRIRKNMCYKLQLVVKCYHVANLHYVVLVSFDCIQMIFD